VIRKNSLVQGDIQLLFISTGLDMWATRVGGSSLVSAHLADIAESVDSRYILGAESFGGVEVQFRGVWDGRVVEMRR
jgi:hypothetical protein